MNGEEFKAKYCDYCGVFSCSGLTDGKPDQFCPHRYDFDKPNTSSEDSSPETPVVSISISDDTLTKSKTSSTSGMVETSGHILEIGDHVKMNIAAIGKGDMDGVEFTANGKNYWRYMNQHPDEVYTVVEFDYSDDDQTGYVLSGYMSDNNWFSDELILVPEPKTYFEAIKSMTLEEMTKFLSSITQLHPNLVNKMLNDEYKPPRGE